MNEVGMRPVRNCPILEQTGDGRSCGRCWHFLPDGKTCPRHGDVEVEVKRYAETGCGTVENEMRQRKGLPLLGEEPEVRS